MAAQNECSADMIVAEEGAASVPSTQALTHTYGRIRPLVQKDDLKDSSKTTALLKSETSDGDSTQLKSTNTTEGSELPTNDQGASCQSPTGVLIRRISRTHSDGLTVPLPADDSRPRPPTRQQSRESSLDESADYIVPNTTRSRDDRSRVLQNQHDGRAFGDLLSRLSILEKDAELSTFQILLRKKRIQLIALPLALIVTALFAFIFVQFMIPNDAKGSPRPEILGPVALAFGVFVGAGVSALLTFYLITEFKIIRNENRSR